MPCVRLHLYPNIMHRKEPLPTTSAESSENVTIDIWRKTQNSAKHRSPARSINFSIGGYPMRGGRKPGKKHERLDEEFRNRYDSRLDLALTVARLSPAFAFRNAVVRLAGTGIDRHKRFETGFTRDYMRLYSSWEVTTQHLDLLSESHPEKYGAPNRDFTKIPRFTLSRDVANERSPTGLCRCGPVGIVGNGLLCWGLRVDFKIRFTIMPVRDERFQVLAF